MSKAMGTVKIYTRTGDKGLTSLIGGERIGKDDSRLEAYGTIDELSAALGLAISHLDYLNLDKDDQIIKELLLTIQHHLLDIGAELASLSAQKTEEEAKGKAKGMIIPQVTATKVSWLERLIDQHEQGLEPLKTFILPGGSQAASSLHLARTICRRAERRVVGLANHPPSASWQSGPVNPELIKYINRLSDLLFVLARAINVRSGTADIIWQKNKGG